jgi:plasmid stabilization system protein ParE
LRAPFVASVIVGPAAAADLAELIRTHSLPEDTTQRVARVLARLGAFPDMGQRLSGRWEGTRYVVGPWPWMLVVYEHHPELDRVDVLTSQDARASSAATSSGR